MRGFENVNIEMNKEQYLLAKWCMEVGVLAVSATTNPLPKGEAPRVIYLINDLIETFETQGNEQLSKEWVDAARSSS